jgi:hypothetical protein
MKHLHYILDEYGLNENIKVLKSGVKLTQREIAFLKYCDYDGSYDRFPFHDIMKKALSIKDIQKLLKANPELLELFI